MSGQQTPNLVAREASIFLKSMFFSVLNVMVMRIEESLMFVAGFVQIGKELMVMTETEYKSELLWFSLDT